MSDHGQSSAMTFSYAPFISVGVLDFMWVRWVRISTTTFMIGLSQDNVTHATTQAMSMFRGFEHWSTQSRVTMRAFTSEISGSATRSPAQRLQRFEQWRLGNHWNKRPNYADNATPLRMIAPFRRVRSPADAKTLTNGPLKVVLHNWARSKMHERTRSYEKQTVPVRLLSWSYLKD